ncbi:hypothetical protein E2C01_041412 [Portunus trituberculatus]|uniref:Uncharacterized protein n=1 Tax=Portunus trituberculatus TaxID=210409 RepID=A0A5B7FQW1_PORTR|nr:hypothetical protein [Portunus trituberculatus]
MATNIPCYVCSKKSITIPGLAYRCAWGAWRGRERGNEAGDWAGDGAGEAAGIRGGDEAWMTLSPHTHLPHANTSTTPTSATYTPTLPNCFPFHASYICPREIENMSKNLIKLISVFGLLLHTHPKTHCGRDSLDSLPLLFSFYTRGEAGKGQQNI